MRIPKNFLILSLLTMGAVMPLAAAECSASKLALAPLQVEALPVAVSEALQKGDYAAVQSAVLAELKKGAITPESPVALHLAMMHELIRVTDAGVLTRLAADADKARFLRELVDDSEWLELYLSCGLVPYQTPVGMDVLYRIWVAEKGQVQNKALAVALASCWGGGETWRNPAIAHSLPNKFNPVRRYQFFQRQEQKGLLHPNYKNLKTWELRFVVCNPNNDWDDASYAFAAAHINMPWDKYHIACWAAEYTDPSKFGDSVQGGAYNLPFADESSAELTLRNGGVCGALSYLGAVAARAHGIPAYTVGQPGHCAYAVRPERGQWVGGFGGPDGSMHNMIFGFEAPTSYNLMEAVFGADEQVARAYRKSFCARALEAAGQDAAAEQMWRAALLDSPMHPFFRTALHKLMLKRGISADECCNYLVREMLPHYAGHGVAAMNSAAELQAVVETMPESQLLQVYKQQHELLAVTPAGGAVRLDELVQKQVNALQSDASRTQYMADMFAVHMTKGDGSAFGQLLEWAVNNYVDTEEGSLVFNAAFARAAQAAGALAAEGDSAESRKQRMLQAYNKAILAAQKANSAPAFAALTQGALALAKPDFKPSPLQKVAEMTGAPAKAALVRLSSTSVYDMPMMHAAMATLEGGKSHTDQEKNPSYTVMLENTAFATGCLLRKFDGSEYRMKRAVVSTSVDGATWFKRAEVEDMPKEWAVQFPAGTRARWVKVEFDNPSPEPAHLTHFVIFTR